MAQRQSIRTRPNLLPCGSAADQIDHLLYCLYELFEHGEDVAAVGCGIDFLKDVSDPALLVDDESHAFNAPVFFAVVILLLPDAVGLGDGVVGIGERRWAW